MSTIHKTTINALRNAEMSDFVWNLDFIQVPPQNIIDQRYLNSLVLANKIV